MNSPRLHPTLHTALCWLPVLAALSAVPCQAQYKVTGADGKVTYTDRPTSADGKVTALRPSGGVAAEASGLPLELRQPVSRYPVTLFTTGGNCEPCESARQLLRQRGIPYTEKQIMSPEDTEALQKISGGRDIPTLSIGSQTLRGLATEVWASYLDAAGYPRDSRLPPNYQYAAPTPIAERAAPAATARAADAAAPAAPAPAPAPAAENPTGIKF